MTAFGVIYGAVAGSARARRTRRRAGVPSLALIFAGASALVIWIGTIIVCWPVLATNFRGLPPSQARWVTVGGLLVAYALYAAALVGVHALVTRPVKPRSDDESIVAVAPTALTVGRRAAIAAGAGGLLAIPAV